MAAFRSARPGRRSQPSTPYRPIMTTSRTDVGKSQSTLFLWGTYPTRRLWSRYGFPKIETYPATGWTSPMIALISVVFPAPFGPMTAISTPAGTPMSTSHRTGFSP